MRICLTSRVNACAIKWSKMDLVSEAQRSYIMSRVKGRDTKPELWIRSALHGLGFRFTVNGPKNKKLPGKPDIVFPARSVVLFVHGCFWHGHVKCRDFRLPTTRVEYWREKIQGNFERDRRNFRALSELGWRILVVWTCACRNEDTREAALAAIVGLLDEDKADRHCEVGDPAKQSVKVGLLRF